MKMRRTLSRRSFLGRVVGGAAGAGSFLALTGCATLPNSDSDPFDPIGRGRNFYPGTGITDADRGRNADPPGRGRGGGAGNGSLISDGDSGPNADPPGGGRGGAGITDGDTGANADPVGGGRGGARSGCTDSDTGRYADPRGQGRNCRR